MISDTFRLINWKTKFTTSVLNYWT